MGVLPFRHMTFRYINIGQQTSLVIYFNMASMTCRGKGDCWCSICHQSRLNEFKNKDSRSLLKDFHGCQSREKDLLTDLFEEVLKSVAIAKAFRINAEGKRIQTNEASFSVFGNRVRRSDELG